ncbi:hypothetical protein DW855_09310 [Faecalibacterium prausnitzii]|uniref:Uncharacterized protein n=1 Tax=Faecalibacterium prausnitzii TaxID=853 RepID=A0A3E2W2I4_9FIRM|nr:hypothetical protein DW855_09310 [Faecalibacterium prausnitzii]
MKTNNILEVVFQSSVFMFEQYIWACFYLSFLSSWLSIFLLVVNIKSIEDFHKKILQLTDRKALAYTIEFACVILVGIGLLICGYYPVSNVLKELPL